MSMLAPNPGIVPVIVSTYLAGPAFPASALNGLPVSAAFPAANRAIYIPVYLAHPVTAVKLFSYNGATASGNIDVGVYNAAGARLISAGSTAQSGTSVLQEFDITDTLIPAGLNYIAVAMDNGTGTLFRNSPGVQWMRASGCAQEASAFPLPATATMATVGSSFYPHFGFSQRTLVA